MCLPKISTTVTITEFAGKAGVTAIKVSSTPIIL